MKVPNESRRGRFPIMKGMIRQIEDMGQRRKKDTGPVQVVKTLLGNVWKQSSSRLRFGYACRLRRNWFRFGQLYDRYEQSNQANCLYLPCASLDACVVGCPRVLLGSSQASGKGISIGAQLRSRTTDTSFPCEISLGLPTSSTAGRISSRSSSQSPPQLSRSAFSDWLALDGVGDLP